MRLVIGSYYGGAVVHFSVMAGNDFGPFNQGRFYLGIKAAAGRALISIEKL